MRRILIAVVAGASLAACRTYETYPKLADQGGLMPADAYAQYGPEEAQKIAIGRKFAEAHTGTTPEARKAQVDAAVAYAKTLPDVETVTPDTLGYWITVSFKSGWRVAISPVADGTKAEATPGLPAAKK